MIGRQTVRDQLVAYLNHKITLSQLVDCYDFLSSLGYRVEVKAA